MVHRPAGNAAQQETNELPLGMHFINGAFTRGSSTERIDVIDPCTERVITGIWAGTAEDVDVAVAAADAASASWGARTAADRSGVLLDLADRISQHAQELAQLESLNTGKPEAVAADDVASAIDAFRFMAGAVRSATTPAAGTYAPEHLSMILREPLGVIGVVTPWNYPLLMAVWKLAPILATGNSVVLKPSEQTPLTTLKLAELAQDLLPAGVLNIVCGTGEQVGQRLAEHPQVAMVALTGSVNSGRAVARAAAESLKRVHLELGGKAPAIIFPDADLGAAAASLRNAGFWNSGQECGAACRILVHESVAEQFCELLISQVASLKVGHPGAGDDIEIGPMISQQHYARVLQHLAQAKASGARAAIGGAELEGPGYFIAPTVLVDVPEDAPCTRDEIFGPVVTVETFTDAGEAIARANAVPFGLAASVWTSDAKLGHSVVGRMDFGTVWVNAHVVLASEMPWGGFKGSGYGRDLSIYAMDDYSRTKHVMHHTGA